jgi:predicted permease
MIFGSVVSSLISLFLVMFVGFFLRKRRFIDDGVTKGLSTILVSVGMPLMMIEGLQQPYSPERLHDLGTMMGGFAVCVLAGMIPTALFCYFRRKNLRDSGAWINCAAFSNAIFMARPIAVSVWGDDANFPLTSVLFCYNLMNFTLGIFLFNMGGQGKGGVKQSLRGVLLNPAIVCGVIGFLLFITDLRLPVPANDALDMLVNITTPLAMIIIGSQLAQSPLREIWKDKRVYLLSGFRLILAPTVAALILSPLIKSPLLFGLLMLTAVMPTGTAVSVFAERYGNNPQLVSRTVFVSTLLSIVTAPVMVALLVAGDAALGI